MNKDTITLMLGMLIGLIVGFSVGKWVYEKDHNKVDPSARTAEGVSKVDKNTTLELIQDREDMDNEKPFDFSHLGN